MSVASEKMFDSMKIAGLCQDDLALVNSVLEGNLSINTETIHSFRKILEKALYSSDSSTCIGGVKKVLQCLLMSCQQEGRYNWDQLHLQFVMLLRLSLNFVSVVTDKNNSFLELLSIFLQIITISSKKSEDLKNTMVKALSTPMIDLILKDNRHILMRRNVIKTLNCVLSGSSRSLRLEISGSLRSSMLRLAELLLNCGDYEFQTAILELIFRFIAIKSDREQFKEWFSKYPEIQNAFFSIPFSDFDPDCRKFLNVVNSTLGSEQKIFTFPSVKAFVDSREIFKPKDKNYKELWIDFNMNSRCINIICDGSSFIDNGPGNDWEIVCVGCNLVKRAFFKQRNVTKGAENAQSLIIEVDVQNNKDLFMTLFPSSANKFEIVFQDSSAINCLTQRVLPALFGNIFEVTNSTAGLQQPISNLNTSRGPLVNSLRRNRKVSEAGICPIINASLLNKYQPLQIVMSPRNPLARKNTERRCDRTDILTVHSNVATHSESCLKLQSVLPPNTHKVWLLPHTTIAKYDLNKCKTSNASEVTTHISQFAANPQLSLVGEEKLPHRTSSTQVEQIDKPKNLIMPVLDKTNCNAVPNSPGNVHDAELRRKETIKLQSIVGNKHWNSGIMAVTLGSGRTEGKLYGGGAPIPAKLHKLPSRSNSLPGKLHANSMPGFNMTEEKRQEPFTNLSKTNLECIYDTCNEDLLRKKITYSELNDDVHSNSGSKKEKINFGISTKDCISNNEVSLKDSQSALNMKHCKSNEKVPPDKAEQRLETDNVSVSIAEDCHSYENTENKNNAIEVSEENTRMEIKASVATTIIENSKQKLIPESSESPEYFSDAQSSSLVKQNHNKIRKKASIANMVIEKSKQNTISQSGEPTLAIDKQLSSQVPEKHSKMKRKASIVSMVIQESKQVIQPESNDCHQHNGIQLKSQVLEKLSLMKRKTSLASTVVEKSKEDASGLLNSSQEFVQDNQLGSEISEKHCKMDKIISVANILTKKPKQDSILELNESTEIINSKQLKSQYIEETHSKIKRKAPLTTAATGKLEQNVSEFKESLKLIENVQFNSQTLEENNCRMKSVASMSNAVAERLEQDKVKEHNESSKDLEISSNIADESSRVKQNDFRKVMETEHPKQGALECSKLDDSLDNWLNKDSKHGRCKQGKYTEVTMKHSKLNRMVFGVKKIVEKPKNSIITSSISLSKKLKPPKKKNITKTKENYSDDNDKTETTENMDNKKMAPEGYDKRNEGIGTGNIIYFERNDSKHSSCALNQQDSIAGKYLESAVSPTNNQKSISVMEKKESPNMTLETLLRILDSQETVRLSKSEEQNELENNMEATCQNESLKEKAGKQIQSEIDSQVEIILNSHSAPVEAENCPQVVKNANEEIKISQKPESHKRSNESDIFCTSFHNDENDDDFKETIKKSKTEVSKQKPTVLNTQNGTLTEPSLSNRKRRNVLSLKSNKQYNLRQQKMKSEVKSDLDMELRKQNKMPHIGMVTRQRAVRAREVKTSDNRSIFNENEIANTDINDKGQISKCKILSVNDSVVEHDIELESSKRVDSLSDGLKSNISAEKDRNNKNGLINKTEKKLKAVKNIGNESSKVQQITVKSPKVYNEEELFDIETASTQIIEPKNIGVFVTEAQTVSSGIGAERRSPLQNDDSRYETNIHTKHKMTLKQNGNGGDKSMSNKIKKYDKHSHSNNVQQVPETSMERMGPSQRDGGSMADQANIQEKQVQLNVYQNKFVCNQSKTDLGDIEPDNMREGVVPNRKLGFKSDIVQTDEKECRNTVEKLKSSKKFLDYKIGTNSVGKMSELGLQTLKSPNGTSFKNTNSMHTEMESDKITKEISNSGTRIGNKKFSEDCLNFEKDPTPKDKLVMKVGMNESKTMSGHLTSEMITSLNVEDNIEKNNSWQSELSHEKQGQLTFNCSVEKTKQKDKTYQNKNAGINKNTEYLPSGCNTLNETSLNVTRSTAVEQILQDWDTSENFDSLGGHDKSINDALNSRGNLISLSFEESQNHKNENEHLTAKKVNSSLCKKGHPLNLDTIQEINYQNNTNVKQSNTDVKDKSGNIAQKSNFRDKLKITNHQQFVQGNKTNSISVSKMSELKSLIERKTRKFQDSTECVQKNIQEQSSHAEVRTGSLYTTQTPNSRSVENRESSKHSSRKRKLYSESNSPALINIEDYDNSSSDPLWTPQRPSGFRKRQLFTARKCNGNRSIIERPETKKKGKKKETEIPTFSFEGASLPQIGEFSPKSSSRWKSKYIDDKLKRKGSKNNQDKKKQSLPCSVYSDLDTDSDGNISWLNAVQKPSRFQKPKITYEKSKGKFPSRKLKKQTFPNKIDNKSINIKNRKDKENLYSLQQDILRDEENIIDMNTIEEVDILQRNENFDNLDNESFPSLIIENIKNLTYSPRTMKLNFLNTHNVGAGTCVEPAINTKSIKLVPENKSSNVKKGNMFVDIENNKSTKTESSDAHITSSSSRDPTGGNGQNADKDRKMVRSSSPSTKSKLGLSLMTNSPSYEEIGVGIETDYSIDNQSSPIIDLVSDEHNDPQRRSSHGKDSDYTLLQNGHSQYGTKYEEVGVVAMLSRNFPKEMKLRKQEISTTHSEVKDIEKCCVSSRTTLEKQNTRSSLNMAEKQNNLNKTEHQGDSLNLKPNALENPVFTLTCAKNRDNNSNHRNPTKEIKRIGKSKSKIPEADSMNEKKDCDLSSSEKSNKTSRKYSNFQRSEQTNEESEAVGSKRVLISSSSEKYYEQHDGSKIYKHQNRVGRHDIPSINSKHSSTKGRDLQESMSTSSSPQMINLEVHNIGKKRMSEVLSPHSDVGNCSFMPVLDKCETVETKHWTMQSIEFKSQTTIKDKKKDTKCVNFHSMYDEFDKFFEEFEDCLETQEHSYGTVLRNSITSDNCKSQEKRMKEYQDYQVLNTATKKGDISMPVPEINGQELSMSDSERNAGLISQFLVRLPSQTSNCQVDQNDDSDKYICDSFVTREERENLRKNYDISENIENFIVPNMLYDVEDEQRFFLKTKEDTFSVNKRQYDVQLQSYNQEDLSISRQIESDIISFSHDNPMYEIPSCSASKKTETKHVKESCLKENLQHTASSIQNMPSSAELINYCPPTKQHKKKKTTPLTVNSYNLLLTQELLKPSSSPSKRNISSKSIVGASLSDDDSGVFKGDNDITEIGEKCRKPREKRKHRKDRDYTDHLEIDIEKASRSFDETPYPVESTSFLRQTEDDTLESCSHILECTENKADIEFNTSTSWVLMNSHKQKKEDFMRRYYKEATQMIEGNFKENFQKGYKKRKEVVGNYLDELTEEMKNLEKNINQLNEQETRLQKLQNYVKRTFSLHRVFVDEMSESNSHLLDMQRNFNKQWNKVEKDEQRQLKKGSDTLKKKLDAIVTEKMQTDMVNEFAEIRQKMQAILPGSN